MLVPKDGNQTEPRCRLSSEYCQPILSTPVSTSGSGPGPADIADVAMDITPHKSVVPVAWSDDYFQERVPVMQMWAESKSGTAVSISATRVEAGRVAY